MVENVIIMGAAGRDFHNFNIYFRDNKRYNVVAFTATQIPDIEGRRYPPELAGELYPDGIPIYSDEKLFDLIKDNKVDLVSFSYSDVPHLEVMHKASIVTAAGADFIIIGAPYTMLKSKKKVISVCAVRTGCGKSQTSRRVVQILQDLGKKVVVVRHPMPYGDLTKQVVQRFSTFDDLEKYNCTVEEREEYEPMLRMGAVVYAGVDYEKILRQAEEEADVIIWDGGNNDTPFFAPDIHIVVFDPHRPGHETSYHPGETNLIMADLAIINKVDSADPKNIEKVRSTIEANNPKAVIIQAESEITAEDPGQIKGKRVLVVEDGPTLTHGEMDYGAGVIAAKRFGADQLVDPRPYLVGTLKQVFQRYPPIGALLPAMGYTPRQVSDLEATINRTECDLVLVATPIDLTKMISINKPVLAIRYEYKDHGRPTLKEIIIEKLQN
ncbi:MAG: GTPase [Deltaproteobacteria bacterium]|nr:GTPase [Deltaproteobacteria bacterium]MBW1930673.1 GTPase [Deltaproteobacteria bacterium]MBW2023914.1 GTPase [Deltaproteobacteria bacterium]MBW2126454.1 GTPase [Deltaproteobacteria bacterium]RLB23599.1 MAG: GTPase [Deltaproteobacteria bacterium]